MSAPSDDADDMAVSGFDERPAGRPAELSAAPAAGNEKRSAFENSSDHDTFSVALFDLFERRGVVTLHPTETIRSL